MTTLAAILGAIGTLGTLGLALFNYFKKTPEQKERDRLKDAIDRDQRGDRERIEAIDKAKKTGDTSVIEDIINR